MATSSIYTTFHKNTCLPLDCKDHFPWWGPATATDCEKKMKNWDKGPYLFSQHLRAFPTHSWPPKPPPARLCGLQRTRTRALIQPSSCHRTAAHSSYKQQLHPQCPPLQQQLSRTLVIFITSTITTSCSKRIQWKPMGPIHSINSIKLVESTLGFATMD